MREYACRQTSLLLGRLAAAVTAAAVTASADSIHDIRVAMRRLSSCLRVFAQFYPPGSRKKIRRRIAALMDAAGAVRDCDIAIELARQAGFDGRSTVIRKLGIHRHKTSRDFLLEIRRWEDRQVVRRWANRLEL